MELRDLLLIDVESLSPIQAKYVVRDVIDTLAKGVPGEDQPQLRSLLISAQEIATGRRVGDKQDTIRVDVLQKIQDAEARGDKRTARYLAESIVKHDTAAVEAEEHRIANPAQKFIDDEIAASEGRQKARQQQRIDARTQELLRVSGYKYDFSPEKARNQATREVVGRPRYEDDVNDEPEKPDRQAILDAHKGLR
jgi:hypothetical protein